MQFKHPEILYFLFALLIPILVHLFQLQKFKKVPFTNVAFLKKISQQTRKSSTLKKWLVLLTRLFALIGVIFAFSQPYFPSKNSINSSEESWLYLDNSLSLKANGKKGILLQVMSKEILENLSDNTTISLQTNDDFFKNIKKDELNSVLKNIGFSPKSKTLSEILLEFQLKNKNETNRLNKYYLLSDFQNINKLEFTNVNGVFSLISEVPQVKNNVSIDSLLIKETTSTSVTVLAFVTNHGIKKEALPFSIYINKKLNNKQTVSIEKNQSKTIEFLFQKSSIILGEIQLDFQDTFLHDNRFNFSLDFRSKIKVLCIGKKSEEFAKIFNSSEFDYSESTSTNSSFNEIPKQQLIILNELSEISSALQSSLQKFSENGGNLLIIPNNQIDIISYNQFFKPYYIGKIETPITDSLQITQIEFDHPIFTDVFSKRVRNFEYPTVYKRYASTFSGNPILSFSNINSFLQELKAKNGKIYWVSAPINIENSNFISSPLIVPTFYNIAYQSISISKPYYFAGESFDINIKTSLKQDEILKISRNSIEFTPLQQSKYNSVDLNITDQIKESGFYSIMKNKDTIQQLAINYHPNESSLMFADIDSLAKKNKNIEKISSISELFKKIEQKNTEQSFWRLFLTLAIVSLFFEILILKFFKA